MNKIIINTKYKVGDQVKFKSPYSGRELAGKIFRVNFTYDNFPPWYTPIIPYYGIKTKRSEYFIHQDSII